jgi:hypothetical protein
VSKFYGLVVLTLGAVWLAPAGAQDTTDGGWLACMNVWRDEAICGPPPPPPPPPAEEEPPQEEQPPPPPAPPPSDVCGKGNQHGFGLSHSRGGANGHCDRNDRHGKKHKHGRRNDHRAQVKAALNRLAQWCKAMARSGRH